MTVACVVVLMLAGLFVWMYVLPPPGEPRHDPSKPAGRAP
jgi:hypothetical protein